jgi:hypothetical protein
MENDFTESDALPMPEFGTDAEPPQVSADVAPVPTIENFNFEPSADVAPELPQIHFVGFVVQPAPIFLPESMEGEFVSEASAQPTRGAPSGLAAGLAYGEASVQFRSVAEIQQSWNDSVFAAT